MKATSIMPEQPNPPLNAGTPLPNSRSAVNAEWAEKVRNSKFIVEFNAQAPQDRASRVALINEIAAQYDAEASFGVEMFNGAYAIDLNRQLAPEQTEAFLSALNALSEVEYAGSDSAAFISSGGTGPQ